MATSSFRIERREAVAHFILCDSASRNALKWDFWMQFPKIVRDLDRDGEIRALILRGDGNHFSSGIDVSLLSSFVAGPGDQEFGRYRANLRLMLFKMHEVFEVLATARFPSIAAVQGACLGGALDLVTACDLRIATSDAYFSVQEIQMGMVADLGALQRLPRQLPQAVVRELAYTGRRLAADKALKLGFVSDVLPSQPDLLKAAETMADEICARSPLAVWGTKESFNRAERREIEEGLSYIAAWNAGMFMPEDVNESLGAITEKRKARYRNLMPIKHVFSEE
jgi:enoyl-CoA hydratase